MARIQILELPTTYDGDTSQTPFAVIIDQLDEAGVFGETAMLEAAAKLGARAVLGFTETIDIPANDYSGQSINAVDGGTVSVKVVPDFSDFGPGVEAAIADANLRLFAAQHHAHVQRHTPGQTDASTDAVRALHRPIEHRGTRICAECSAADEKYSTTDNSPVLYPCATITALDGNGHSG